MRRNRRIQVTKLIFQLSQIFIQIFIFSCSENYWKDKVLGVENSNRSIMVYKEDYNSTSDVTVSRTYALPFLGNIGNIKWDLAIALGVAYIVAFVCLSKGIRSSGRAVFATATLPLFILIALLIRTLMLEGAFEGVA